MAKDLVRAGYGTIAAEYLTARKLDSRQLTFLHDLADRLTEGASVLDAGCGSGVPVTQWLSERFSVTGVDISEEQIRLARRLVPEAEFLCHDMTTIDFPDGSFDAICSFYAVIHVPREEHRPLLANFYRMLKAGGLLLLTTGNSKWEGVEEFFGTPMYWSHHDAETNLRMIEEEGFHTVRSEILPDSPNEETSGNHLFLLAEKREANQ